MKKVLFLTLILVGCVNTPSERSVALQEMASKVRACSNGIELSRETVVPIAECKNNARSAYAVRADLVSESQARNGEGMKLALAYRDGSITREQYLASMEEMKGRYGMLFRQRQREEQMLRNQRLEILNSGGPTITNCNTYGSSTSCTSN